MLALLAGAGWVCLGGSPWAEENREARVDWEPGGAVMTVTIRVTRPDGQPERWAGVRITNSSGTNDGRTDAAGVTTIGVGEPEVQRLEVNGRAVLDRPNAHWTGNPGLGRGTGLRINVQLKEARAAGR